MERSDGRRLTDRARIGGRLRLQLAHRLDDPLRSARIANTPACHGIGLRAAIDRQCAIVQVRTDLRDGCERRVSVPDVRSEEHTSELQSLMRTSYPVFCCKIKN